MYGAGFMRGNSMINQGKINGLIGLGQFFGGSFAQTGSEEQQIEDMNDIVWIKHLSTDLLQNNLLSKTTLHIN